MKIRRRPRRSWRFVCAFLTVATVTTSASVAEDWPGWRGAKGDAVWSEDGILEEFPEGGLEIRWRAPVGEGYSGPSVAAGRVFVADFLRAGERKLNGEERIQAFDEETGEVLWSHQWEVGYGSIMASYATGPRAVPTADSDHVYVLGAAGDLICLDAESGEVVWQKNYPSEFDVSIPIFGFSSAPILYDDLLIALVGGEPDAMVVAFDKKTGEERWRSIEVRSEPGYAAPLVVNAAGHEQLLIWHPLAITSLVPETGEILWNFEYETKDTLSVAAPAVANDRLFLTQFYGGSLMLELVETEDGIEAREIWRAVGESEMPGKTAALQSLITSPIFDGETVFGVDSYGELRALDGETGERIWEDTSFARQGRWGAAFSVKQGDRFVALTDDGDLVFYRLDREAYQELDRVHLIEPTTNAGFGPRRAYEAMVVWSHPAFANQHVIVRNDREVLSAYLGEP